MMLSSCFVCSSPAKECHFGSKSQICRACSAFFRRFVLSPKQSIKCLNDRDCNISYKNPKTCRFCRMKKCVNAGMRHTAVQPPRDKYSKDRDQCAFSPQTSGYSWCPLSPQVKLSSHNIPRLSRLGECFKKLESVRRNVFQHQEPPKSRNMGELIDILKIDIKLVSTFVENSFPELNQMGILEKRELSLHFFVKYMILEPPFLGTLSGNFEAILPNGDYYDKDVGNFYTGHLKSSNSISKETADKIFTRYWEQYKRTVIEDLRYLKLDVFEFLALSSLVLWDTGVDGLSENGVEVARKMRESIITETQFYYKNIKMIKDPCLRLAQVMMILNSLQKSFVEYQEELQMCGFYKIYDDIDPEAYKIIKESMAL